MLLATVLGVSPASATAPTGLHPSELRVIATDDRYLVYAEFPRSDLGTVDYSAGRLYKRTAGGDIFLLDTFDATKWLGDTTGLFDLSGGMLTASRYPYVQWWDLDRAASGVERLPDDGYYLDATPTGWLFIDLSGGDTTGQDMVLRQEQPDGTVSEFAAPFGTPVGHQVEGSAGPAGFLAIDDPTGMLEYLPWSSPAEPVRVKNPYRSGETTCTAVTTKVATCRVQYDRGDNGFDADYHEVVFLDGKHKAVAIGRLIKSHHEIRALRHHGSVTATGRGLAVLGANGRIYTLSYDGTRVQRATRTIPRSARLLPGDHSVIAETPTRVFELETPHSRPHRILGAVYS